MKDLIYWIWLSLRCGAGSELASYLLVHFKTPRAVFEASEKELLSLQGISKDIAAVLLDRDLAYPEKVLTYCERMNVGIMTLESEIYPERLRAIHAKPIVLYYRGRMPDIDDNVLVACVGTRKCSTVGAENAYRLGYDLAEAGAIVVSGMALGIDSAAQMGALDAGGHTIAVLGCGIDRAYPSENKALMERIAEKGTVLTEFAPGTDPNGKNFPIRNRIISGLSQGTVVVEADMNSGALITAGNAERQGRDIFAYPGNVADALSAGTNALIQNGATLVTSALDVLGEYEFLYPHRIFTERLIMVGRRARVDAAVSAMRDVAAPGRYTRKKEQKPRVTEETIVSAVPKRQKKTVDTTGLSEIEALVVTLTDGVMSAEEIAGIISAKAGKTVAVGELLGILTMLEIGGYVEALPGGSFRVV
jgi:DNA processing protein